MDQPVHQPEQSDQGSSPSFSALGLKGPWLERLQARGIETPAPIQALGIPAILSGGDIVLCSRTGSGKTLAYLLPALERIDPKAKSVQVLVLAPTAELAMQIAGEAAEMAEGTMVRTQALIGGASLQRQLEKLKNRPHLVVGTPGRILEMAMLKKLKLSETRMVIVDEADQTFALGQGGEAEHILSLLTKDVQKVFCSATFGEAARMIAAKRMKNAVWVEADVDGGLPPSIEHSFIVCDERDRIDTARRLVRTLRPKAAILFLTDTDSVGEVEAKLRYHGLEAEAVYGAQPKQERADVMRRFRSGRLKLLIATDVAARGIDSADVTHVIHIEPPLDAERYLHRAGRTGRMGRHGESVLILSPKQRRLVPRFAKELGIEIREKQLRFGKWQDVKRDGDGTKRPEEPGSRREGAEPVRERAPGRAEKAAPVRTAAIRKAAERTAPSRAVPPARAGRSPKGKGIAAAKRVKPAGPLANPKNKGAPRWLKAKWARSGGGGDNAN